MPATVMGELAGMSLLIPTTSWWTVLRKPFGGLITFDGPIPATFGPLALPLAAPADTDVVFTDTPLAATAGVRRVLPFVLLVLLLIVCCSFSGSHLPTARGPSPGRAETSVRPAPANRFLPSTPYRGYEPEIHDEVFSGGARWRP